MRTFISFLKEFRLPKKAELAYAIQALSKKQFWIFIGIIIIALFSVLVLLQKINNHFLVEIPADGGSIVEGIVGIPSLVNPVLALSDADKDLTAIVYSGLMRKMPDGRFIPDLAESYTISPDGTVYTFVLKKKIFFHNGDPITTQDIAFTIQKIQDPLIKSPRRSSWDGVSVSTPDDETITFTLKKPYISFMDNMTLGILPSRLWKNITPAEFGVSTLNVKAIGSGPFMIDSISRTNDGIPETYTLKRFRNFTLGTPHITSMTFISYANEAALLKALLNHSVDQAGGISPENAQEVFKESYMLNTTTLPRMFGIFFNTTQNKIFADKSVMSAFNTALDRKDIIDSVLSGYGTPISSPLPSLLLQKERVVPNASLDEANTILDKGGWTKGTDGIRTKGGTRVVSKTKKVNGKTITQKVIEKTNDPITRLAFSLTTGDTPELKDTAFRIKSQLEQLGVLVDVKVYETGQLNQLIRARDYESLFFGQVINHESDLFSFWHSSQRTDPGLNIALYSNPSLDSLLEKILATRDAKKRTELYQTMNEEFTKNIPALFVYSPTYIYATNKHLGNISFETLTNPSDRFSSIYMWYATTDKVWKIFTK